MSKKPYRVTFEKYGIQITRKDGTRFLACKEGAYVAMFTVHQDASRFAKELREFISKGASARIVKLQATFTWSTP